MKVQDPWSGTQNSVLVTLLKVAIKMRDLGFLGLQYVDLICYVIKIFVIEVYLIKSEGGTEGKIEEWNGSCHLQKATG